VLNIIKVVDNSMLPNLKPEAFALVRATWLKKLEVGDIVIVNHLIFGAIIKRLVHIDYYYGHNIAGDNPHSVSTGELGKIWSCDVVGVVLFHT